MSIRGFTGGLKNGGFIVFLCRPSRKISAIHYLIYQILFQWLLKRCLPDRVWNCYGFSIAANTRVETYKNFRRHKFYA